MKPPERRVLEFIIRTVSDRGYPPSIREMCDSLGFASTSSVHRHIHALVRGGYLKLDPNKARSLTVLDA